MMKFDIQLFVFVISFYKMNQNDDEIWHSIVCICHFIEQNEIENRTCNVCICHFVL